MTAGGLRPRCYLQNKTTMESGAESPTTVRPLDMDDDDVQDTSLLETDTPATATTTTTATPPSNPSPGSTEVPPPQASSPVDRGAKE